MAIDNYSGDQNMADIDSFKPDLASDGKYCN